MSFSVEILDLLDIEQREKYKELLLKNYGVIDKADTSQAVIRVLAKDNAGKTNKTNTRAQRKG